jgi:hypothetical protein
MPATSSVCVVCDISQKMTHTHTHTHTHTQSEREVIPLSPPHIAIAEQNAVPEERLEFLVVALEEGTIAR